VDGAERDLHRKPQHQPGDDEHNAEQRPEGRL
jgi:hypothetical protein